MRIVLTDAAPVTASGNLHLILSTTKTSLYMTRINNRSGKKILKPSGMTL